MQNDARSTKRPAIILLTRVPESGTGKKRLSPLLSEHERVDLQKAMIADEYRTMKDSCEDVLVFCTPFDRAWELRELLGEDAILLPQEGSGLGKQMKNAFNEAFRQGYSPCLLAGSDIPSLSREIFEHAFSLLEGNDAVIAPTKDGGYCLIGLNRPCSTPFTGIGYGTGSVFDSTCEKLREAGLSLGVTKAQADLDTPEDLREFARGPELSQCPRTNAVLKGIVKARNQDPAGSLDPTGGCDLR